MFARWIPIAILIAAVAAALIVGLSPKEAESVPPAKSQYRYRIVVANGDNPMAGTVHPIHFQGKTSRTSVTGRFKVSTDPLETTEHVAGPYPEPLNSLTFTLNGSDFRAPDNWIPTTIRVYENVQGEKVRVVADHNPWNGEFNESKRSHEIFTNAEV